MKVFSALLLTAVAAIKLDVEQGGMNQDEEIAYGISG